KRMHSWRLAIRACPSRLPSTTCRRLFVTPRLRRLLSGSVALGLLLVASVAMAKGYGKDVEYRELFDKDGAYGFITPRVAIWIVAQLHLLFGAFVLAV